MLPVLAAVQIYGGIDLGAILTVLGLCFSSGLFAAALAMVLSTYSNKPQVVILLSYFTLAVLYVVAPLLLLWFIDKATGLPDQGVEIVAAVNPFVSMNLVIDKVLNPQTTLRLPAAGAGSSPFQVSHSCIGILLVSAIFLCMLTARRVRTLALNQPHILRRLKRSAARRLKSSAARWLESTRGVGEKSPDVIDSKTDTRTRQSMSVDDNPVL